MLVAEIPEQTGPDVEQKLKTKSGGEFEVPGGVPRGARARGPQFTPPQRFATFALRLQPFASEFRDGAPVCSENDAFPERNGDLNFATEHMSAAKTMPGSAESGTRAEISVSLQTGARSPVGNPPPDSASQLLLYVCSRLLWNLATEHRPAAKTMPFLSEKGT